MSFFFYKLPKRAKSWDVAAASDGGGVHNDNDEDYLCDGAVHNDNDAGDGLCDGGVHYDDDDDDCLWDGGYCGVQTQ